MWRFEIAQIVLESIFSIVRSKSFCHGAIGDDEGDYCDENDDYCDGEAFIGALRKAADGALAVSAEIFEDIGEMKCDAEKCASCKNP